VYLLLGRREILVCALKSRVVFWKVFRKSAAAGVAERQCIFCALRTFDCFVAYVSSLISDAGCVALSKGRMTDELERMRKETAVA
jgi:hypothetical protein